MHIPHSFRGTNSTKKDSVADGTVKTGGRKLRQVRASLSGFTYPRKA